MTSPHLLLFCAASSVGQKLLHLSAQFSCSPKVDYPVKEEGSYVYFTWCSCSQDQADSFLSGAIEVRPPSKTYKQALVNGLMAAGLTQQEAELYVDLRGSIPLMRGTG